MNRSAFTLIELTIVIVVFGIVAMISSEIITKIYERYLINRNLGQLETKTELALDQISKRLQYRVKSSVIARKGATIVPVESADSTYDTIEWIGYDNDGLRGRWDGTKNRPGWSGLTDLLNTDTNRSGMVSNGSRFDEENETLATLTHGSVSMDGGGQHPAIIFKFGQAFDIRRFGWNHNTDHNYSIPIHRDTVRSDRVLFDETPETLYEQYYLAWSAYALLPVGSDCSEAMPQDCNLTLRYDFQPWYGEEYNSTGTKSSILLDHITLFRFKAAGNAIHIKLCATDRGFSRYLDENISICKERVIY